MILQYVVADPLGVNLPMLIEVLEEHYRNHKGEKVTALIGQGFDGIPVNTIVLEGAGGS